MPEKGEIYTVRQIRVGRVTKGVFIHIEEIRNVFYTDSSGEFSEPSFDEQAFSPISNIKIEFSEFVNKEVCLN